MAIPGLPPLPPGIPLLGDTQLLIADAVSLVTGFVAQWGIFLDGVPVVLADNVVSVDYRSSSRISKYPQEQGAFASYNKVIVPAEAVLRFSTGGSVSDRQAFIQSIAAISDDLNLYDIVTPEITYTGYNVIMQGYPRVADEAGLVTVEVRLEQVVIAGASQFSNTQNPTDQAQQNNGLVNGQPVGGGGQQVRIFPQP